MFKKKKYTIIKKAVSKELCLFLYNYLLIKRQVLDGFVRARALGPDPLGPTGPGPNWIEFNKMKHAFNYVLIE